jgi:Uma2 family endonuclease
VGTIATEYNQTTVKLELMHWMDSVMYQTGPQRPPKTHLPTMYDLKSEDPGDPGLPDVFHDIQPQLLRETFCPPSYTKDNIFVATDLNLYYDLNHLQWYKRPDWFAVLGIPHLYESRVLRLSYVQWQEGISPFIVIELLSPGTEKEDLGQTLREANQPPTKWEVYQDILKIPYYVVFDRYTDQLTAFALQEGRYQELSLESDRLWLPEISLGLGLWHGSYENTERLWLRWYDATNNWILNYQERAEQERQRADQEQQRADQEYQRAERLSARLRELNIPLDD